MVVINQYRGEIWSYVSVWALSPRLRWVPKPKRYLRLTIRVSRLCVHTAERSSVPVSVRFLKYVDILRHIWKWVVVFRNYFIRFVIYKTFQYALSTDLVRTCNCFFYNDLFYFIYIRIYFITLSTVLCKVTDDTITSRKTYCPYAWSLCRPTRDSRTIILFVYEKM